VEACPLQLISPLQEREDVPGQGTVDCCYGSSAPSTVAVVAAGLEPSPGIYPSFVSTSPSRVALPRGGRLEVLYNVLDSCQLLMS
jgi:hypothetical protein